jgi:multimeric flavodoxin WrbA
LALQRASAIWPRRCAIASITPDPVGQRIADRKDRERFASTATQHGGQETTLTSFHTTLLQHGMVIASSL